MLLGFLIPNNVTHVPITAKHCISREGREKRQLKYRITAKAAIRARISVMNSKEHFRFKKIILRWTISDYTNALHYDLRLANAP